VFRSSLIILEGQRVDVILGMNWMKMHKVMLDNSAHLVHLDSPIFSKVTLQLPPIVHLQAPVHIIIPKSLKEIPMVCKYLDVFPDDFPMVPPDRAIKFKIDLQIGVAPVYKWMHPMTSNELIEMKI
jgi:hypothetical protein